MIVKICSTSVPGRVVIQYDSGSTKYLPPTDPEVLAWIDDGGTIDPYVPPPAPTAKERREARYKAECDQLSCQIKRHEARLKRETLTAEKRTKIEGKLAAAEDALIDASKKIEQEIQDPE